MNLCENLSFSWANSKASTFLKSRDGPAKQISTSQYNITISESWVNVVFPQHLNYFFFGQNSSGSVNPQQAAKFREHCFLRYQCLGRTGRIALRTVTRWNSTVPVGVFLVIVSLTGLVDSWSYWCFGEWYGTVYEKQQYINMCSSHYISLL